LDRLDIDALSPDDPFEVDGENAPHLAKHLFMVDGRPVRVTIGDVRDYYGAAVFYEADPARGPAHWLVVCRVDSVVVTVPIIPANSSDPAKCRPIGLFETTGEDLLAYLEDEGK
jgi:hypothetical protein